MKIIDLEKNEEGEKKRALCAGFFDGLHIGHQKLIQETIRLAKKNNLTPTLLTFNTAPKVVLKGEKEALLTPLKDKLQLASEYGIKEAVVVRFDKNTARTSPEDFIKNVLLPLHIRDLIVGFDFTFGYKGKGNVELLKKYAAANNFRVRVIPEVRRNGEKVASRRLIEMVENGEITRVNRLLKRPYRICGKVKHGNGNGKKLGFPTANLSLNGYVVPKRGVYAIKAIVNKKTYVGMANVGVRPTIGKDVAPVLEVHLFADLPDFYRKNMQVFFWRYLREEKKFADLAALKKQMERDKSRVLRRL